MNSSAALHAIIVLLEKLFTQCSDSSQQLAQQITQQLTSMLRATDAQTVSIDALPRTPLKTLIDRTLSVNNFCSGAGLAYHTATPLTSQASWSLYWVYNDTEQGSTFEITPLTHQHLDFRTFEWFLKTKTLKAPYFHGPYVDYICNTSYTMTSAAPIFIDDHFYGVAAVDILVSRVEEEVLRSLPHPPIKMVLTNPIGRIIFSTLSGYRIGDILRSDALVIGHQHPLFTLYLPA